MSLVLEPPVLLVVSDGTGDPGRVRELGQAAAEGGAWGFQLREPQLGGRALSLLVEGLHGLETRIIVNDRVDVALAGGVFGVQLGERSLPLDRVRRWVGTDLRLGRSVHDGQGARSASGADWLVFGHVFATASKPGLEPAGIEGLRRAIEATSRPVIAIGGITRGRVAAVLAQGASGVAVVSEVAGAEDPVAAVRALRAELASGREEGGGTGGTRCVKSSA